MEFSKRKVLLLNEDIPNPMARPPLPDAKHGVNTSAAPQQQLSTPASPLQVAIRPVFASSVAYVFLILFTTFFFIGFVFLYFRQFPSEVATFRRSRSRPNRPSAAAKSLPVVAHRGEGGKQAECAICLEELGEGEAVKVIPQCGHVFHPQCIDTWLEAHVSCPVCRCSEFSGAAEKQSEEVESV